MEQKNVERLLHVLALLLGFRLAYTDVHPPRSNHFTHGLVK